MVCIHVYSMAPSITVQYREQKGPFLDKDDSCESSLAISNNYVIIVVWLDGIPFLVNLDKVLPLPVPWPKQIQHMYWTY